MQLDDEYFDCCLYLGDANRINPGDELLLPIDFLSPELVLPKISPGTRFQLVILFVPPKIMADGQFTNVKFVEGPTNL